MSIAYLNGQFLPLEEARISPLDRGFLFGDGVYEVIPSYDSKTIGFKHHIDRIRNGLNKLQIEFSWSDSDWLELIEQIIEKNDGVNLAVYIQISRGADSNRAHQFPNKIPATIFAMVQSIAKQSTRQGIKGYSLKSMPDQRWKNCDVKSTSLLGNVLHFQQAHGQGYDEAMLYNERLELTECGASNIFVVKNNLISTPPLDRQILPGVTRKILIDAINDNSELRCEERIISLQEARDADEIWITSSTKEIAPVVKLDDQSVGTGLVGAVWEKCIKLFNEVKFDKSPKF